MTNLFRRGSVASLLMYGEAWNNFWRCNDDQSDQRTAHVVEDGMSGRQGSVSGETWGPG
jgi:hypothetical protein